MQSQEEAEEHVQVSHNDSPNLQHNLQKNRVKEAFECYCRGPTSDKLDDADKIWLALDTQLKDPNLYPNDKSTCRWDMFPGITVCERQTGLPAPQQSGNHQQAGSQNGSSPDSTRLNLAPASSPDKQQYVNGDQSPRGPLSVDLSEGETSRSGTVDDELARTFDLRDLESAEYAHPSSQYFKVCILRDKLKSSHICFQSL